MRLETIEKERIDKLVASQTEYSRSRIQDLIVQGYVLVNDMIVKPNYRLKKDDEIELLEPPTEDLHLDPINLNLDIVYEDEDVAVVYKPKGLSVHPASSIKEPTLVNGLLFQLNHLSGINGTARPGIVHRIDKDTTGLLMIAKNDLAHQSLVEQLKNRTITRRYVALVHGVIKENRGRIEAPIARCPYDKIKMDVVEGGKQAITNFTVLERFKDFTLVECKLETGRTHQIRVHMKYINHPLYQDKIYGPDKSGTGQFLHAQVIGFNHPRTGKYLEFSYPLPENFSNFLEELRRQN